MRVSEAIGGPETWARWFGWATAAGIVLGVIGPFGSYLNGGAVARIAYWTGLLWAGTAILGLTVGPAFRLGAARGLPVTFIVAAATLLACIPLALVVAVVAQAAWPGRTTVMTPLDWYAQTLFVAAPLIAGVVWFETRHASPRTTDASSRLAESVSEPEVIDASQGRLSARLRAEALCLQMEDHYVRVHLPDRSELVLSPMRQAIQEVGEGRGLQVHRSWWVARAAVRAVKQDGRSVGLILSNGLRVPVARNRIANLRESGWL